jgi:hypothetical protein
MTKCLLTELAFIWFDTCMYSGMSFQTAVMTKGLLTELAFTRCILE